MQEPVQYPTNPFLVSSHKENSGYGVKFAIKGLRRSVKVSWYCFVLLLALCYYCSFLFEQSEAGLKVLGIRQYGFDAEWLREKCGLMEVAPYEFVRGQSVLASVDNEIFFSGIFCVLFSHIFAVLFLWFFVRFCEMRQWFCTIVCVALRYFHTALCK